MSSSSSDTFASSMCRRGVASICHDVGFNAVQEPALKVLMEVYKLFVRRLASRALLVSESDNRGHADLLDVMHVLVENNESFEKLNEFLNVLKTKNEETEDDDPKIDLKELSQQLVFPPQPVDRLSFLKPGSREVLVRPLHINDYFPPMYPDMEDDKNDGLKGDHNDNSLKEDDNRMEQNDIKPSAIGSQPQEHQPLGLADRHHYDAKTEFESIEGASDSSSSLREMSSVMMTSAGFISPARIGKLPHSRSDNGSANETTNDDDVFENDYDDVDTPKVTKKSKEQKPKAPTTAVTADKKNASNDNSSSNAKKLSIFQKKKPIKAKAVGKRSSTATSATASITSSSNVGGSKSRMSSKPLHQKTSDATPAKPPPVKKSVVEVTASKKVVTPSPGLKKESVAPTSFLKKSNEAPKVISKLPPINQALKQVAASSSSNSSNSASTSVESSTSTMSKGRQSLLDQTRAVISKAVETGKQKEAKKPSFNTESDLKTAKLFFPKEEKTTRKSGNSHIPSLPNTLTAAGIKTEPTSLLSKLSSSVTITPTGRKRPRDVETNVSSDKLSSSATLAESSGFNFGFPDNKSNKKTSKPKASGKKTSNVEGDVVILKEAEPEVPLPLMMMNNPLIPKQFYYGLNFGENEEDERNEERESKRKKHLKKDKERKKKEKLEKRSSTPQQEPDKVEKEPPIPRLKIKEVAQLSPSTVSKPSAPNDQGVSISSSLSPLSSAQSATSSFSNKGSTNKRSGLSVKPSGIASSTTSRKRRSVESKVTVDDENDDEEDEEDLKPANTNTTPSSTNAAASGGTIITQTVGYYIDADGNQIWICPACGKQDDGSAMIGCDSCDDWYHWLCVGISQEPEESQNWYCQRCVAKKQLASSSKGAAANKKRTKIK